MTTPQLSDFEQKALDSIDGIGKKQDIIQTELKTSTEKILADYSRLDGETKKAFEELTKVKNACNDMAAIQSSMTKVMRSLEREKRAAFGDPVARFCADEENSLWVNAMVRRQAFGPTVKLPDHLEKALERAAPLTGVDSGLGSAVIPTGVWPAIYDLLSEHGVWSSFDVIQVPNRTTTLPVQTARPGYYWVGKGATLKESVAITESEVSGTSKTLEIQTLACLFGVTRELLQDGGTDIAARVSRQLAEAVTYGLDFTCLQANGGTDNVDAEYHGIFDLGTDYSTAKAEAGAGNTTAQLTDLEDWERCLTTVNAVVLTRTARWWMHPHILSKVMMIRDSNNRPLFQSATEAPSPGSIGSILGYSIQLADAAPNTNAASAKIAVFGDPMGLAVGIRADMEIASSDQFRFSQNQIVFRSLMRCGVMDKTVQTTVVPFAVLTLPAA